MAACGAEGVPSDIFTQAYDLSIPVRMHWDITWRCDHKCVHCYLTDRRKRELTYDECVGVLDQLVEAGTMFLLMSGGDLFLRPDAAKVLRAARDRQFDVKIITHGNFIDDALADDLADMGVSCVAMSLYSGGPEAHEAVTRIPGSHQKTVDAARRLRARGVKVQLKTPVMVHNRDDWHTVGDIAREHGCEWAIDGHIMPDDQSDFGLTGIGLSHTERILAVMKGMEDRRDEAIPVHEMRDTPSEANVCSAAQTAGYISPDGTLYPCINWRDPIGNLRDHAFAELWWHHPTVKKQREIRRASYLEDCEGCGFHGKCGYCPGISHAEHEQAGRRSAYVCERTHLTMAAIDYMARLNEAGDPVPDPSEAESFFSQRPTFAERQLAARRHGMARPADRLRPRGDDGVSLVQIAEPRPR